MPCRPWLLSASRGRSSLITGRAGLRLRWVGREILTQDKCNVLVDSFVLWRVEDPLRFAQTVRTRIEAEARLLVRSPEAS